MPMLEARFPAKKPAFPPQVEGAGPALLLPPGAVAKGHLLPPRCPTTAHRRVSQAAFKAPLPAVPSLQRAGYALSPSPTRASGISLAWAQGGGKELATQRDPTQAENLLAASQPPRHQLPSFLPGKPLDSLCQQPAGRLDLTFGESHGPLQVGGVALCHPQVGLSFPPQGPPP